MTDEHFHSIAAYSTHNAVDPVLDPLVSQARQDPGTLGLILHGSRGAGMEDELSDYDLVWVFSNEAFDERATEGRVDPVVTFQEDRPLIEISYTGNFFGKATIGTP